MSIVRVAATAEEDLKESWLYVAQHNPGAATKLIKEITSKFAILRDYPQMGQEQQKLLINLRSFTVQGYLIFYQPFDAGVEILRALHGSRDIESIFDSLLDSL